MKKITAILILISLCLILGWQLLSIHRKVRTLNSNQTNSESSTFATSAKTNELKTFKPWVRPPGFDDTGWAKMLNLQKYFLSANQPIVFFGRATDQSHEPVIGARVEFHVIGIDEDKVMSQAFVHMKMGDEQKFSTNVVYSDATGWIKLQGITGQHLAIFDVSKDGYDWQRPEGLGTIKFEPDKTHSESGKIKFDDALDPYKGMAVQFWKKSETEKLVQVNYSVGVEPYGTNWHAINLLNGMASDPDFIFGIETKNDANGNPERVFHFQVLNGGLQLDTDAYPYSAPANGYVSELDWYYEPYGRNANQDLSGLLKKKLFFKLRNGNIFGAINWGWESENGVGISGYLNPVGSRNLEPDPNKLITDPAEIRQIDEATRLK